MDYSDAIEYLNKRLPAFERHGPVYYKPGLERIRVFCEALGNPQNKYKTIHIGGTNGKGSTASLITAILQSAGYKTGLHVSPHLKSFTERAKVDGKEMPLNSVGEFLIRYRPLIEEIGLSYFEFSVAWAFYCFAREQVDIAVVEVGMGGTYDASNIIHPILSIITNISFDHVKTLGPELTDIAKAKAGIIKPETPIIIGKYQPEVADVFVEKSDELNAPLFFADDEEWIFPDCQLKGDYQQENFPAVLKAIQILRAQGYEISKDDVIHGFANVCDLTGFKGRWQVLQKTPLVIADGAHNEAGLTFVAQQIRRTQHKNLYAVLGCTNDKNIDALLSHFSTETKFIFAQANIPRAMNADLLAQEALAKGLKAITCRDVNEAYQQALSCAQEDDLIFIGGSLYLLGELDALSSRAYI